MRGVLRILVCVTGLAAAAGCNSVNEPTPGVPPPGTTTVSYTALGASDAIGYGGSAPCIPFSSCPDGTGYVQIVARRLREANTSMEFLNLGVPGAVLSKELQTVGNSVGRGIPANFTDSQVPFIRSGSTLVTVFADANGANGVAAALRPLAPSNRAAFAQTQIANFARDFAAFVAAVADRAPAAKIVVLNLPNLARLPYAAGYSDEERHWLRVLSTGFTSVINVTRSSRVRVIDLMCHAPIYQASLYSNDGYHPNDAGYRALADLVSAAITTEPPPAPAGCSFMN
jgi:lysophospholipase L1-like esterase